MYLTTVEEHMLQGKFGSAVQKSMQILVALGEIYDAEKMIPVSNVHMPGSSVVVAGDAGLSFVEKTAETNVPFKTYTTLNTAAIDFERWKQLGIPEAVASKQKRLTNAYLRMGAVDCHTCTPYLVGNIPRMGEHVAWGESSAIAFLNSVIGARTNREGGPSALASALTGRTPFYGLHKDENRRGKKRINVTAELRDITDYGTLGYFVGSICGTEIPVFVGMPQNPTLDQLKMLGAALASSGGVALYHIVGVTPEAKTEANAFQGEPSETLQFGPTELDKTRDKLSKATDDNVDIVCLGCPHASILEIREIAEYFNAQKVHHDIKMWICTSQPVKAMADRLGYTRIIEKAGGVVACDTCPVLAPTKEIVKILGYKTIVTNSAKLAHYATGQCNLLPHYGDAKTCLSTAVNGRWKR